MWADEGVEGGRGGGAGGGDGEREVREGGREADYEGERWDGGRRGGGWHCWLSDVFGSSVWRFKRWKSSLLCLFQP